MKIPRFVRFVAVILAFAPRALFAAEPDASAEALKASGLTSAQLLAGLKSGLGTLVDLGSADLAKPGALQVQTPSSMNKLESMLKKMNQSGAFDSFKASLNQAAMKVAPQSTAILKGAIGPLSSSDAMGLLNGAPTSGTQVLRKSSESALRTKLMPLVSEALAANGTAAKAKDLLAKAGPMASMMGVPSATDLENHLLTQVLDATFGAIGKQETALRANPAQFKDALATKVFSLGKK